MRKVAMIVILILVGFFAKSPGIVLACNDWCPGSECTETDPITGACTDWYTSCCDGTGGGQYCYAGYYACNSETEGYTGCCPIGSGGGGGGGNGAGSHIPINCPAGTTRTNNVVSLVCWLTIPERTPIGNAEESVMGGQCGFTECQGQNCDPGQMDAVYGIRQYQCVGPTPTCSISGPTSVTTANNPTYTITSSANAGKTEIWRSPTNQVNNWSNICSSAGNCAGATNFSDPNLDYYVVGNAYQNADGSGAKCSSNPWLSAADIAACWTDCGASCRLTVNVTPACVSSAPAAPVLTSPSNGVTIYTTSPTLSWNTPTGWGTKCPAPNANDLSLYFGTTNPPPLDSANLTAASVSRAKSGLALNTWYYWKVRATNGQLTADSTVRSFRILDNTVAGQVFNDLNGNCTGAGWSSGGVSVSIDGAAGVGVSGTGTFSTTAVPGQHNIAVSIPATYVCSTGATCPACSKTFTSPSNNNFFYLTQMRNAWWQTEGAGIYAGSGAGGTTIQSIIPSTVVADSLYLVLPGAGGSAVAALRASGSLSLGSGSANANSWSAVSKYKGKVMNYDYFSAKMGVLASSPQLANLDTEPVDTGADFYYKLGSATVGGVWDVTSGESYVVFVDGDLRINEDITVASGGFLAFIVNGSITIDPSVANLQGIYIADTNFVTESQYVLGLVDDSQLLVEGTVVAWGTLSLSRNLGLTNMSTPAELFTYRSDLLTNMPDKMKAFAMNWEEVVAGTFE